MKPTITLESVAIEFLHWRKSRVSNNEAIPDILRNHAIELLSYYKKSQIIAALRINHSTLKRWRKNTSNESVSFVALAPEPSNKLISPDSPDISMIPGINITLRNLAGTEMCINGDITPVLIRSVTDAFIEHQGGIS